MLKGFFHGLFDPSATTAVSAGDFLLCVGVALAAGLLLALGYMYRSRYTKSFVVTLAILPAVVCVVIMMVNGNIGTGVAVAGAFSLVRFRSVPGTAREIAMLFLAMGSGLIAGMGYLGYCLVFTLLLGGVSMLYSRLGLGAEKQGCRLRTLQMTVPEDLNYSDAFTEVFAEHTAAWELVRVKTTNMGSLFRLTYELTMKDAANEKAMLDQLRCRNGNLEISLSRRETPAAEL